MKKIIVLTLVIVSSLLNIDCQAQYESLLGDSATFWSVKSDYSNYSAAEFIEWFGPNWQADTVINGQNHQVLAQIFETSNVFNGFLYLYEDTTQGLAWYRVEGDTTRYFIYDLTLAIGDTFYLNSQSTSSYYIIQDVNLQNGLIYQDLGVLLNAGTADTVHLELIEGTGANVGFQSLNGHALGNGNEVLLCHTKDDSSVYATSLTQYSGKCWLLNSSVEGAIERQAYKIYPNPVESQLFIEGLERTTEYFVYSIESKQVLSGNLYSNSSISLETLPAGIYLLRIEETVLKFIKQ